MWLSDFEEAIAAMKEHCKWSCFTSITISSFGDRFIFQPHEVKDFYFVYFRDSKKIVKQYFDTWRKPDHYEVIYEGDYSSPSLFILIFARVDSRFCTTFDKCLCGYLTLVS